VLAAAFRSRVAAVVADDSALAAAAAHPFKRPAIRASSGVWKCMIGVAFAGARPPRMTIAGPSLFGIIKTKSIPFVQQRSMSDGYHR
jgi:hypothetical protein